MKNPGHFADGGKRVGPVRQHVKMAVTGMPEAGNGMGAKVHVPGLTTGGMTGKVKLPR